MKNTKRILSLLTLLCFIAVSVFSFTSCVFAKGQNLIFIIGDGMGYNHIENAKTYMGIDKFAFEDYYVGDVTTRSADNHITDSAASATAMATGTKTNNGYLGINPSEKELMNIMELSKKQGKRTGIVTTDALSGATPAGFSVHVDNRDDAYAIAEGQATGAVDLLMGKFISGYSVYQSEFTDNGFIYAESMEEIKGLSAKEKIVANIKNVDSAYNPELTDVVTLKEMVEYALDYLSENNPRGFTLMVEGAYIDKHSHSNDIMLMIYAVLDLNDAVEYILEWASERDDTSIIFTADHETGGLYKADNKDAISNDLYSTGQHTAVNVPLFLYNIETDKKTFDNTDLFDISKGIVLNSFIK